MIFSNTSINHYSSGIIDDFRILKPCDDLQDFEGDLVAMSDFDLIEFQLNTWENDEYANAKTFCLTQFFDLFSMISFLFQIHFMVIRKTIKHKFVDVHKHAKNEKMAFSLARFCKVFEVGQDYAYYHNLHFVKHHKLNVCTLFYS